MLHILFNLKIKLYLCGRFYIITLNFMKLVKLFCLLMVMSLAGGFMSCSDDDDDNNTNGIVGTWIYKGGSMDIEAESNYSEFTSVLKEDIAYRHEESDDHTLTLDKDGNFKYNFGKDETGEDDTDEGTYTFKNGILSLKFEDDDDYPGETETYETSVNGNSLKKKEEMLSYYKGMISILVESYGLDIDASKVIITKASGTYNYTRK